MKKNVSRSPLFYVGDKYKLINEIKSHFPSDINQFVEPFVGGGSVFMNVEAENFCLNDIDKNVISIHRMLNEHASKPSDFYKNVETTIKKYGLSYSYKGNVIPEEMKRNFVKTYYAHYNKLGYEQMRFDYNQSGNNIFLLYMLLIYGFNHMLRFNQSGNFNLPVGNVDFNKNVVRALNDYFEQVCSKEIEWYNLDFEDFLGQLKFAPNDLIYLDPPYLITFSEYNKLWNENTEKRLLRLLDKINQQNVRFAISNVTHYKDKTNQLFLEWSKKYNSYSIKSNYISYHDNSNKVFNEVLVTNY